LLVGEAASYFGRLRPRSCELPELIVTHGKRDRETIRGLEGEYPRRKIGAEFGSDVDFHAHAHDRPCAPEHLSAASIPETPVIAFEPNKSPPL
jgi:hypothetical protein